VKREEKLEAFEKLLRALLWPSFRAYGQPAKPWKTAQESSQEVIEGWIALKRIWSSNINFINLFNSQQRGVPIVYGGEERVQISSLRATIYSIK
jgi:hypothetical protein